MLLAKVDEIGKPAWIALTVFGFWWFWPVGLAVLAFLLGSGRLRAWRMDRKAMRGRWSNLRDGGMGAQRWSGFGCGSSGNQAFDAYKQDTLRRLEEEQQEFQAFLERLRQARDKAEFDQFMADRRPRDVVPTDDAR